MFRIGKYNILERIGKGGMGVVYRARDTVLEREVALKTHTVGDEPDAQSVERFFREARVVASLKHQNIITVFDLGQERDKVFIAMEILEGEDLTGVLSGGRHISLEAKVHIVESVARGLAHAHDRGIVHRDIKPRNVFLCHDGTVKLLDFGLAHIAYSTLTVTGQIIGTPFYMSPEQALGEKASASSDIFSLGSLFYELLTGVRAFERPNLERIFDAIVHDEPTPIRELDPTIPEELVRIVSKMMAKTADRRYRNVDLVLRDLSRFDGFLAQYKTQLRREASRALEELNSLARHHGELVAEHDVTLPPPELNTTVEREDLSYMSLVGLRDGASLQLRRLELLVEDFAPPPDEGDDESDSTLTIYPSAVEPAADAREHRRRRDTANERYRAAGTHYARGDLAASLRLVSEALRLDPDHDGALELAEKVRVSIVRLVDAVTIGNAEAKHFDILVAALLAIGEPGGERHILAGQSSHGQTEISSLSDIFLSGLPRDKADPDA
jgi:serine/threonine protein kinase